VAFAVLIILFSLLLFIGGFWTCFKSRHEKRKYWASILGPGIILVSAAATLGLLSGIAWILQRKEGCSVPIYLAFGSMMILASLVLGTMLCVGLMGLDFPDSAREWLSAISARNLIMGATWAGTFTVSEFAPPLIINWFDTSWSSAIGVTLAWLASTAAGILSGRSPLTTGESSRNEARKSKNWKIELIAVIAPPIAVVGLLLAVGTISFLAVPPILSYLSTMADPYDARSTAIWLWALSGGLLGIAALLSTRFNINEFSMSHFYKNRLVRCYLGASSGLKRRPNRLTGFDPHDDFPIAELLPGPQYKGPFAIVNCALNLNHGKELAWQERKASSFVFTPMASGYSPADKSSQAMCSPKDSRRRPARVSEP
jgi:hypothetical protein